MSGLHVQPEPDGFTHESPIRAFTVWRVNGRYAIGKGFRPSLAHLTVYLDAMERLEGWEMRQILEAASGSPSFVFRRTNAETRAALITSVVEEAEQACRYVLNHNLSNMDHGEYRDGFEIACEICEQAISEHVRRHEDRL